MEDDHFLVVLAPWELGDEAVRGPVEGDYDPGGLDYCLAMRLDTAHYIVDEFVG